MEANSHEKLGHSEHHDIDYNITVEASNKWWGRWTESWVVAVATMPNISFWLVAVPLRHHQYHHCLIYYPFLGSSGDLKIGDWLSLCFSLSFIYIYCTKPRDKSTIFSVISSSSSLTLSLLCLFQLRVELAVEIAFILSVSACFAPPFSPP